MCMNLEFLKTLQTKPDTEMDAEMAISATIIHKTYTAGLWLLFSSYIAFINKN